MHVTNNMIGDLHHERAMRCIEAHARIVSGPVHTWTLSDVYASADLRAAMEAAVLPDEEDLLATAAEQPQSSQGVAQPRSDVRQHTAAQQLPLHSASVLHAEQPQRRSVTG